METLLLIFFALWSQAYFIAFPIFIIKGLRGTLRVHNTAETVLNWSAGLGGIGILGSLIVSIGV